MSFKEYSVRPRMRISCSLDSSFRKINPPQFICGGFIFCDMLLRNVNSLIISLLKYESHPILQESCITALV